MKLNSILVTAGGAGWSTSEDWLVLLLRKDNLAYSKDEGFCATTMDKYIVSLFASLITVSWLSLLTANHVWFS